MCCMATSESPRGTPCDLPKVSAALAAHILLYSYSAVSADRVAGNLVVLEGKNLALVITMGVVISYIALCSWRGRVVQPLWRPILPRSVSLKPCGALLSEGGRQLPLFRLQGYRVTV